MISTIPHLIAERADQIADNLCSGRPDSSYLEAMWAELERIVDTADKAKRMELMEDLSLVGLAERTGKRMAEREADAGKLPTTNYEGNEQ